LILNEINIIYRLLFNLLTFSYYKRLGRKENLKADALGKVGKEGVISLEKGKGIVTELEITEGMKLDS
jgi:hypothetical protein